jgi:hypothetical protein
MKKIKLLTVGALFFSVSLFSSCKKEGCTDLNADNYDGLAEKSGSCVYRYGYEVSVSTPSNVDYDPLDAPDLYIRFAKNASANWDYSSNAVSNNNNITVTYSNFLFSNETWAYEVYDQDTFDSDDLVSSGTFNPLSQGSNGNIVLTNNGCTVTFRYITK